MSSNPITTEERRENKKKRVDKLKKDKMLLMKNSDQNAPGDHLQMFIKEVGKRKFVDRHDDRSGIRMWGFEVDKKMWVVKRKSKNIKYYAKMTDFVSGTIVDLAELVHAPFHNPTNDPNVWAFKNFLEDKAKMNFEGMKTTSSFIKETKDIIESYTNKTLVNVMWPPTTKAKKIPITQRLLDGLLNDLLFWVYDEATTTMVIKMKKDQIQLVDPRDLLKFVEHDIHMLSKHLLMVENEMFEAAAKDFTSMIATIINKKWWAGALDDSDMHIMEKP